MNRLNEKPGITAQDVLERIDYKNIADMIPEKEYDFVDFFCGAGGMSYGFHRMAELTGRLRWAGAVDIDKHAIDTYEHNYGCRPTNLNLGEADIEEIRNCLRLKKGNELILIGCAPCQGFSSHRKKDHRGPDNRNTLVVLQKLQFNYSLKLLLWKMYQIYWQKNIGIIFRALKTLWKQLDIILL